MGHEFFVGMMEDAIAEVIQLAERGGGYCCLTNVHVTMMATRDVEVSRALEDASAVFPDGAPLAWLQRRAGHIEAERVAGSELLTGIAARGTDLGLRHFFYGSTPATVEALTDHLSATIPKLTIAGALAPEFGTRSRTAVLEEIGVIRDARPDVVWVALGAPKQELWMRQYAKHLEPAVVLGVGAAFDFLSGARARAPLWMQRHGLEWLHRLACEPRRLGHRYITTNSSFLIHLPRTLAAARLEHLRRRDA